MNKEECEIETSKAIMEMRKRIADLEKENAELKEKYAKNITDCDICDTYCNSQLTKAKELLKQWVELFKPKGGNIPPTPIQVDTEQFLSEVEK